MRVCVSCGGKAKTGAPMWHYVWCVLWPKRWSSVQRSTELQ